jgi:hypothetical protein
VPRSAVLGHPETLLAAVRHLITNENCAAHFLRPGAATGQASYGSLKAQSERKIAMIVKRREVGRSACEARMLQCGALGCAKHHQA